VRQGVKHAGDASEFETPERCSILEIANDPDDDVSIARARVRPGITTQWHRLAATDERYIITEGVGRMELPGVAPMQVVAGDVVRIPQGTAQRITNTGREDLVFFCVCNPRFRPEDYEVAE